MKTKNPKAAEYLVHVDIGPVSLEGKLDIPDEAEGIVLFAHGSGSGRNSPRNRFVARKLGNAGLATLLIDLLTEEEESIDQFTAHLRFDISLLAERLVGATDWLIHDPRTSELRVGYFGASTGAAAALVAAAHRQDEVAAVVSRGGRPDLAGHFLPEVHAPVLLLVGGDDEPVIGLNQQAFQQLQIAEKKLIIIPAASHLFEEPGTLEQVALHAEKWFQRFLSRSVVKGDRLGGEAI